MADFVSGVLSDLERVLLDAEEISLRVAAMAAEVQRDCAGQVLTVVALMDGALFFVADLLRQVDLPVRLVTLSASSYYGGTESSGQLRVAWPPDFDVKNQHVLVLDDILDTGLTLGKIRDHLEALQPAWLRVGVLLAKRRPRARQVVVEYLGFEIEDEFVVGYGMDYEGRFRNLPCVGVLKP
ncbi:MAG: hypoxanthine phosphoribosyltransferase [Verrucomicrobiales bacterium]|nr:hypoxanthine phosphoribosyltransferase [Verrucomicrobiales bacterium]